MSTAGKIISCKAAVCWAPNEPLSIETVEVDVPKSNEVRVKIEYCGVCHSDLGIIRGENAKIRYPIILGHEAAGVVESVGPGVTKFQVGDHVIPLFIPQCYECKFCKNSRTNWCSKTTPSQQMGLMLDLTSRFTCKGKMVYHFMATSCFTEYTVLNDINLCKINDKAPLEKVCLIGCGVTTGMGASVNTAKVEEGSTCGVWGLGAIGLATVMGCKIAGAKRIIGIDINPEKFKIAEKFGCTEFINPNDLKGKTLQATIAGITDGGLDYSFECVGHNSTMKAAFDCIQIGYGIATMVGIAPSTQELCVNPIELIVGKVLKGSVFGGYKSHQSVPELVEKYLKKEFMVDEFITHNMNLQEINEAFDLMISGKSIRTVLKIKE